MSDVPPTQPPGPIQGVGLCLSGGGFRATLFNLGVVERLYARGVLDQVGYLSTVSGGSVVGALLALNWRKLIPVARAPAGLFDELVTRPVIAAAKRDIRNRTLRRSIVPWRLLTARGNLLAAVLDDSCFHGATLDQLPDEVAPPNGLHVAINAASLRTGKRFRFSRHAIGDYTCYTTTDVEKVEIATAVAASAAFPPAFAPLVLPFKGPYHAWDFPDRDAEPEKQPTHRSVKGPSDASIPLVDGGVYDNIGVSAARKRTPSEIIAVDAGAELGTEESASQAIPQTLLRSVDIMMARIIASDVSTLVKQLDTGEIEGCFIRMSRTVESIATVAVKTKVAPVTPGPGLSGADAVRLSRLRTDFDAFSDLEIELLRFHGQSLADVAASRFLPQWVTGAGSPLKLPAVSDVDRKALAKGAGRDGLTLLTRFWET